MVSRQYANMSDVQVLPGLSALCNRSHSCFIFVAKRKKKKQSSYSVLQVCRCTVLNTWIVGYYADIFKELYMISAIFSGIMFKKRRRTIFVQTK
jgi:hypothetical protein